MSDRTIVLSVIIGMLVVGIIGWLTKRYGSGESDGNPF